MTQQADEHPLLTLPLTLTQQANDIEHPLLTLPNADKPDKQLCQHPNISAINIVKSIRFASMVLK